jgi:GxxExxY protein
MIETREPEAPPDEERRMEALLYEGETYRIRGAIFEVYKEMGSGFLEAVYQECLEKELIGRDIPFVARTELRLSYKGQPLDQVYVPDLICFGSIIVELKAVAELTAAHRAQLMNYLKATGLRLGLLVNFGAHTGVVIDRIIR